MRRAAQSLGTSAISLAVYSCAGCSSTCSTGPDSTTTPSRSTTACWATDRTSARLWVMNSIARCRSRCSLRSSSTMTACTDTSSADVTVQAVIVEELRRLQRERHLAMLFITHNLALVRSVAQHAVVLRDGVVVESGPVEQVLERPVHEYTVRLMADVPRL